jgi:hypothetical protein
LPDAPDIEAMEIFGCIPGMPAEINQKSHAGSRS